MLHFAGLYERHLSIFTKVETFSYPSNAGRLLTVITLSKVYIKKLSKKIFFSSKSQLSATKYQFFGGNTNFYNFLNFYSFLKINM